MLKAQICYGSAVYYKNNFSNINMTKLGFRTLKMFPDYCYSLCVYTLAILINELIKSIYQFVLINSWSKSITVILHTILLHTIVLSFSQSNKWLHCAPKKVIYNV